MQRREFLGAAAVAAAQRVIGANDRVTVGLIGCGGRGRYVAGLMREAPSVEFAATADVYLPNAERAKEWAGPTARSYQDFRRLLEQKDIDAVLVATPDHWHAAIPCSPARPARTSMSRSPWPTTSAKGAPS